ncbi:site-specific integrase [Subdoligranulum variabile]|uniref:tyrosine-type recombinase/integrase n=1 Tax=Subdoligranulum variabile TaxID=214851 RepID=UPI0026EF0350|nr:site-specific integrase [Subdoligranulum variabile]
MKPRARAFCALCLYAGLRKEEALGLCWDDIGPASMAISRGVTFPDGNQPDPSMELKNRASRRVLPLPKKLREILLDTPHTSEYVVPSADGTVMTSTAYQRMWQRNVSGMVDFPVHAHMLRHTYATTLYRAGVDLRTAQQLLGHATIQMTAEIYTHLEAEDSLKAVHRIDEYLEKSTG